MKRLIDKIPHGLSGTPLKTQKEVLTSRLKSLFEGN